MTLADQPAFTGLILAGGQGRRMGGRDKGLVQYKGKALVDHVIECLAPQVEELLISANRNLGDYAIRGYPILVDDMPDFQGPLAGVLTGLQRSRNEWMLAVPCDMPNLPDDLALRLWSSAGDHSIVVASDGERTHPALMLVHKSTEGRLADYLNRGERSVHGFQESVGFASARFNETEVQNINSLDEMG